jgi:hypothetical protein
MKIRRGFVSNSSSSSFIVAGLKCKKSQLTEEIEDMLYKSRNIQLFNDGEDGYEDPDYFVIGKTIATGDDMEFPEMEYNMEDLREIETEIQNETDIEGDFVIIAGTRLC